MSPRKIIAVLLMFVILILGIPAYAEAGQSTPVITAVNGTTGTGDNALAADITPNCISAIPMEAETGKVLMAGFGHQDHDIAAGNGSN